MPSLINSIFMNKEIIKFRINDEQYIAIINLDSDEDRFYRYDKIEIIFFDGSNQYILFKDDLIAGIDVFNYLLKKVIHNDLELHESIKNDIGFLWQENLQKKHNPHLTYEKLEGRDSWVGKNYLMWCSQYYSTWLFNKDRSIILEISPEYSWHSLDPDEEELFVEYNKWIKEYSPIKIITIKPEIAQVWLNQTEDLLTEIVKSDTPGH